MTTMPELDTDEVTKTTFMLRGDLLRESTHGIALYQIVEKVETIGGDVEDKIIYGVIDVRDDTLLMKTRWVIAGTKAQYGVEKYATGYHDARVDEQDSFEVES